MGNSLRFLDDFIVGHTFTSHTMEVTEADIIAYARQFDPQSFHTDPVAAKESVFGGLCASGWHTAAITMRLFVDSEFSPFGGLVGAGIEVLEWPWPVRPGDVLHVEGEILSVRASKTRVNQGIVIARVSTMNQHGQPVQLLQPKMIVPRRPLSD